jgi:hypothetical protein
MRSIMTNFRISLLLIAVLAMCTANVAYADLIFNEPISVTGTGFGTVAPIMTMQTTGAGGAGVAEQGCSGWNGSDVIIGLSACAPSVVSDDETQPAYTGADSKPPAHFPHNDAPLLSSLGITDGGQVAIVFNPDQSGPDHPITINDLTITLWDDATGKLIWNSGDLTGGNGGGLDGEDTYVFAHTDSGVGKTGIVFLLDSTQVSALDTAVTGNGGFGTVRIGLSGFVTGATGGPDTFSVANVTTAIPEPASILLLGSALLGLGLVARKRQA